MDLSVLPGGYFEEELGGAGGQEGRMDGDGEDSGIEGGEMGKGFAHAGVAEGVAQGPEEFHAGGFRGELCKDADGGVRGWKAEHDSEVELELRGRGGLLAGPVGAAKVTVSRAAFRSSGELSSPMDHPGKMTWVQFMPALVLRSRRSL